MRLLVDLRSSMALPPLSWVVSTLFAVQVVDASGEELLHIIINGVKIEKEIGDACDAFNRENWPAVGYNVARLTKTLL